MPRTIRATPPRPVSDQSSGADWFDVAGPPDAPVIVFVHGTRLARGAWSAQVAGLAGEFRTVVLDLPGHGHLAAEPFTLDGAADRVADVIDRVGGGRAVVVGLSLGGYVAMVLAARSPERVRGLVIAGATAEPVGPRSLGYLGLAWVMETFDRHGLDALNRWFFRARYPAAIAEPIIADGFWSDGGATALRALVGERFIPRLAAYPGPTLLLNGEYDVFFRPGSRRFARAAHDARRVLLRGATHLTNLDEPAAFNEAVRRFARGLDAAEGSPTTG
jgi:pimeloyl-ACP methyl ester carboxylesterase